MKQFVKSRLIWIKKKLRYPTANGMTHFEFDVVFEVIKYLITTAVGLNYRFLRNLKRSIIQMTSMRTVYR